MSKRGSDALLACLSALMTAFTFRIRDWTGLSRSVEWPIGAAVLLMIVWLIRRRREGIRTGVLLASIIGIGAGLSIGSALHRIETGRPLGTSLGFVFAVIACTWLYFTADKGERRAAAELTHYEEEWRAIANLPPDQAREAFQSEFRRLQQEMRGAERNWNRYLRRGSLLVAVAAVVVIAALPLSLTPEPKPLMIVAGATILVLCVGWFVLVALAKRAQRNSPPPPEATD